MCKLRVKHWDIRRMLNDSLNQWRYVLASLVGLTILTTRLMVGTSKNLSINTLSGMGTLFWTLEFWYPKVKYIQRAFLSDPSPIFDIVYCLLF